MTKVVTDHMIREALSKVVHNANRAPTGATPETQNLIRTMEEKLVTKVCNTTMICSDGTEAELVSPMPCLYWKCMTTPDANGIATLQNPVGALIVTSDDINYCLGIIGKSNEFEIRMKVGDNEVRVNNNFINIATNHLVINGLETKINEEPQNNGGTT